MAIVWATTAGNVSVAANWNTGVVPGINDTVHADGKAMVVDLPNWSVESLRTTQRSGGTLGGSFTINASSYVATVTGFYFGATASFAVTAMNPEVVNLVGAFRCISQVQGLAISGNSSVFLTGDTYNTASYACWCIAYTSSTGGSVTHIGNILQVGGWSMSLGGNFNSVSIYISGNGNYIHTGNISSSTGCEAVSVRGTGNFTSTGIATSSSLYPAIYSTGTNNIFYTGILQMQTPPSATVPVIYQGISGTGCIYFKGIAINSSTTPAIYAIRMGLFSTGSTMQTYKTELGTDKSLYSADYTPLGNPAASNVRSTITYGPANELVGSLIVCPKSSVAKNVPTDDGVGTMEMLPSDFWAYANRTLTAGNLTAQEVWEYVNRTITSGGITAAEIWGYLFTSVLPDDSFGKLFKDYLNAKVGDIPSAVIDELTTSMEDVAVRIRNLATTEIVGDIHAT